MTPDGRGTRAWTTVIPHVPEWHEEHGRQSERVRHTEVVSGPLTVWIWRGVCELRGRRLHVTPIQWRILATLAVSADALVPVRDLIDEVWGTPFLGADDLHLLRVHMARLRAQLREAAALIETIPGRGYRLRLVPTDERLPRPPRRRWALAYDRCVVCAETVRPHAARGVCTRCHKRDRVRKGRAS
jgi:hypothetical protein